MSDSHMFTCISCAVAFNDPAMQRSHFASDWHRYNMKVRDPFPQSNRSPCILSAKLTINRRRRCRRRRRPPLSPSPSSSEESRLVASRLGDHVQRKSPRKEGTERHQVGPPGYALRMLPVSLGRGERDLRRLGVKTDLSMSTSLAFYPHPSLPSFLAPCLPSHPDLTRRHSHPPTSLPMTTTFHSL